jgi:hypothetical protein
MAAEAVGRLLTIAPTFEVGSGCEVEMDEQEHPCSAEATSRRWSK